MKNIDTGNLIVAIVYIVFAMSIAIGMYPVLFDITENVTGNGFVGSGIVAVMTSLYWIIIGVFCLIIFILKTGLFKMTDKFQRNL